MDISDEFKCNYFHILEIVKRKRANDCTQDEMAIYMKVSRRKIGYFEGGKIDVLLLFSYCDYLGVELELSIKNI